MAKHKIRISFEWIYTIGFLIVVSQTD